MSLRAPVLAVRLACLAALPGALALPGTAGALALPGAAGAGRWRSPVAGRVAGAFTYDAGAPFAAGARRGIDLAAPPGSPVVAACTGVVTWTGRVPGGASRGVTIRCGGLVATQLGLGVVVARRGSPVRAGAPLGTLGAAGRLRLGARRAEARWGYVDPALLLARGATHPPPAVAPGPPPRDRPRGAPPIVPNAAPRAASAPSPSGPAIPGIAAAAGLVLLAASVLRHRCPSTSRRRSTTSTRLRIWGTPTRRSRPT